jgi:hypothetical protein
MPTDESRLPLMPILPWQRPPTTRNRKGQWMPGVCGNPRGRPTNARLAAKRAAKGSYREKLQRAASYEGITPEHFVRLARIAYGKSWQGPLAGDLNMSLRGVIRWAKGETRSRTPRRCSSSRSACGVSAPPMRWCGQCIAGLPSPSVPGKCWRVCRVIKF